PGSSLLEENDAGGEAVDEVLAADRPQFPRREESCQRNRPRLSLHHARIVVRYVEHPRAATVAAEYQSPRRPALVSAEVCPQQRMQILVRRLGVAHMELHCLTDAHTIGKDQRPGLPVEMPDIANQEVAASKFALELADDPADVQAALEQLTLV